MSQHLDRSAVNWLEILVPVVIFLAALLLGYVVRRILFRRFTLWAARSSSQIHDLIISSLRGPFALWFLILGVFLAL
ncbi:MAG: hypothetical protein V2A71_07535, partial [Candidatus Eisenbacteria bacterium]